MAFWQKKNTITPATEASTSNSAKTKKKPRWRRWLLEGLIILAIYFAIRAWQQHGMISGEAPDIMLPALQQPQTELVKLADYQGKPLVVHFWATWCKICEIEHGSISNLNKDWQVLTIATFDSGNEEEIQRYLQRHEIEDWTVVIDKNNSLAEHYGVSGTPSTFVIDSHGEIRFKEVGLTIPWGWNIRLWLTDLFDG